MTHPRKVAIITGASRGIGAGLVEAYRQAGYAVLGTARSMPASEDPDLHTVDGDIAEPETAQRVVQAAAERFGRVDTLVNNAGLFISKPFAEYTPEDFAAITAVNLAGFFHITQRAAQEMLPRGTGHVLNISTSLVDHANSQVPAALTALSKGGLVAATRSLAIEYASRGIRFNAVSLGVIKKPNDDPASVKEMDALHPIGRAGEIADVVDGILYLERAPFITGEILHIDGGQAAGN